MTTEIRYNIASSEHGTRQPPDLRYRLECQEAINGGDCDETTGIAGWLADFERY